MGEVSIKDIANFVNGYMSEALVKRIACFINGFFVKRRF